MYLEDKHKDKANFLDKIEKGFEEVVTAYSENYQYQAAIQRDMQPYYQPEDNEYNDYLI